MDESVHGNGLSDFKESLWNAFSLGDKDLSSWCNKMMGPRQENRVYEIEEVSWIFHGSVGMHLF